MSKIKFVLTYDDWNRACEAMRQQGHGASDDELARITAEIIRLIIDQISVISHNPTITDDETKRRVQSILHERVFHALPHLKEAASLDDCAFWIIDCLHQDDLIVCVDDESLETNNYNTVDGSNLLIVTNNSSAILTDEYWAGRSFKTSHIVNARSESGGKNIKTGDEREEHSEDLTTFFSRKDDAYDTLLTLCSQGVIGRIRFVNRKNTTDDEDRAYLINLTNAPDESSRLLSSSAAPAILKTSEILSIQQVMQMIQAQLALNQSKADEIKSTEVGDDQSKENTKINDVTSHEKIGDHTAESSDHSIPREKVNNSVKFDNDYLILLDTDYF